MPSIEKVVVYASTNIHTHTPAFTQRKKNTRSIKSFLPMGHLRFCSSLFSNRSMSLMINDQGLILSRFFFFHTSRTLLLYVTMYSFRSFIAHRQ